MSFKPSQTHGESMARCNQMWNSGLSCFIVGQNPKFRRVSSSQEWAWVIFCHRVTLHNRKDCRFIQVLSNLFWVCLIPEVSINRKLGVSFKRLAVLVEFDYVAVPVVCMLLFLFCSCWGCVLVSRCSMLLAIYLVKADWR